VLSDITQASINYNNQIATKNAKLNTATNNTLFFVNNIDANNIDTASIQQVYTPQGKIINNISEPLDWEHPKQSSFVITIGSDEVFIELNHEHRFGQKYSPKIQTFSKNGQLSAQTSLPSHTNQCYYKAKVIGYIPPQSEDVRASDDGLNTQNQNNTQDNNNNNFSVHVLTNNNSPSSLLSTQSSTQTTTLSITQNHFNFDSSSVETTSSDEKSEKSVKNGQFLTDFPEFGTEFSLNTCRGGFSGSLHYKGKLYEIAPLINHVSMAEVALIMSQLENQATQGLKNDDKNDEQNKRPVSIPDISSIHIVFDAAQPSYDYVSQYVAQLRQQGLTIQNDDVLHSFCGHSHNKKQAVFNSQNVQKNNQNDHHNDEGDQDDQDLLTLLSKTTQLAFHHYQQYHQKLEKSQRQTVDTPTISSPYTISTQPQKPLKNPPKNEFSTQQQQQGVKYIEWLLVNDMNRVTTLGTEQAAHHAVTLWQTVQTYSNQHNTDDLTTSYSTRLELVLVDQVIWTTDPYQTAVGNQSTCAACSTTEVSVDELLTNFNNWRTRADGTVPHHDNAHLLSGYDFESSVLGYAGVGSMCLVSQSGGINQVKGSSNTDFFGIVVFHELSHNNGARHDSDGNSCPTSTYVMSAALSMTQTTGTHTQLSQCSLEAINPRLSSYTCLNNVPAYTYGDARCGNGILEDGEECDCGLNCTNDPCCDGTTCKLTSTALIDGVLVTPQCSPAQSCCDNTCQLRSQGFVCSPALSDCDMAEVCNGTTAQCPANIQKGAGYECTSAQDLNANGSCFEGFCVTQEGGCSALSTGLAACQSSALIITPESPTWCANKQCVVSGTCSIVSNGSSPLPWDNGTPCGKPNSGKQCYAGECIDMNTIATRYQWRFDEYADCHVCGEPQTRTATCLDTTTNSYPPQVEQCTSPTAVYSSLVKPCNAVELGCVYDYSEEDKAKHKGEIYFLGVWLRPVVIAAIFIGIVFVWVVLGLCCYRCVTGPVDGKKDMSQQDDDPEGKNKKNNNDKKDNKKNKKSNKRRDSGGILLIVPEQKPSQQPKEEVTVVVQTVQVEEIVTPYHNNPYVVSLNSPQPLSPANAHTPLVDQIASDIPPPPQYDESYGGYNPYAPPHEQQQRPVYPM
jgi:hypothetical protein